jgi:hypothetical protein
MKTSVLFAAIITLGLIFGSSSPALTQPLALVHGTVVDVSDFGASENDLRDAVVVIEDGTIRAVGRSDTVSVPGDCKVIDAQGKYILPGLIDGFGSVKNRSFANAYLYMGVTSVIGIEDNRRGRQEKVSAPSPYVFKWMMIPPPRTASLSESDLLRALERMKKDRIEVAQLMYPLKPEQLELAVRSCRENRIATIAELGHTPYRRAIASGVDTVVHTQRYLLDLAPEMMRGQVADDPFGPIMNKYNTWVRRLDLEKRPFREYARFLAQSGIGLIPTLSLYGYFLPGSENPWKEPVAANIDPKDIHQPVNSLTGKPDVTPEAEGRRRMLSSKFMEIEGGFFRAGVKYLTGSGTVAFGTMPGISLHREIELLTQVGLTNRQAIAAATGNFSRIFRWPDFGVIKPGSRADILVLDDNPLADIQNLKKIHLLLLQGKVIDRMKLLAR